MLPALSDIRRTPERIVCLTEEPTETLYLLGEQDRIVGITAYTKRPPEAARDKPVVSAYVGGSVKKIKDLEPDLVIGFSDVQAEYARKLIAANLQVLIFNQRSIIEILQTILTLGRIVGAEDRAESLTRVYLDRLEALRKAGTARTSRPRVYFEEWHDPMISAIRWVSELIEVAGGENIFSDRAGAAESKGRYVSSEDVLERRPDIYIGCWCGKPVDMDSVRNRPGWDALPAVAEGRMYEMDPAIILQPGPACLTDGLDELVRILG